METTMVVDFIRRGSAKSCFRCYDENLVFDAMMNDDGDKLDSPC